MAKKTTETQQQGQQFKDELVIIEPMKVRLSRKGDTVMVFLNQKTVMMFSAKFLDAVINIYKNFNDAQDDFFKKSS